MGAVSQGFGFVIGGVLALIFLSLILLIGCPALIAFIEG